MKKSKKGVGMPKASKILIGVTFFVVAVVAFALFATRGIVDAAQKQLSALRTGDVERAYYAYTSKDFQNATSLENFKRFIEAYPSLTSNQSARFNSREVSNGIGTLEGTLKSKDGAVTPIEYKLVKEDEGWKILGIQLNPSVGVRVEEAQGIHQVRVSDESNAQGYVDQNKTSLGTTTPEIFLSVYLKGVKEGTTASAILTFLGTGDKVGPATNSIEKSGDVITNFSFTKPANHWPVGDCKVTVSLSTGESTEVGFSVK